MDIDRSTLDRYLTGKRPFPMAVLYVASEVLDQDPGYIVQLAYNRFLLDHPEIDHRNLPEEEIAEVIALHASSRGVPTISSEDADRMAALYTDYDIDAEIEGHLDTP